MKYQRNPQTNLQIRIIKKKSLRGRKDFQCRYVYQYLNIIRQKYLRKRGLTQLQDGGSGKPMNSSCVSHAMTKHSISNTQKASIH